MSYPSAIGILVLAAALLPTGAAAADDAKYPDWKGQWGSIQRGGGNPPFDPSKPRGNGQEAPLTPEYQAIFEASAADQADGGRAMPQPIPVCRPACREP